MEAIWRIWRRRPDSVLVPGHDLPMTQKDGATHYLASREAAILSWFGEDLDKTTLIELAVG